MSDKLNPSQRAIADKLEGMMVVDAGPGTGKTKTITERYINLIKRPDVGTSDVLLMTFTRNAAAEMESRVRSTLESIVDEDLLRKSKSIRVTTFDAFCLSVVLDSPDEVGRILGIEEKLTRGASIVENETLNRVWFRSFFDDFLSQRGEDYGDMGAICCDDPLDVLAIIEKLMSRGVFPVKKGWIGMDPKRVLEGDADALMDLVGDPDVLKKLDRKCREDRNMEPCCLYPFETATAQAVMDGMLSEDRTVLFRFIHDVYFDYVKKSIASDRLTFGITSMLAFVALYGNAKVRERNKFRYVMVDEFQDTNACQMMICLMILSEPNLCVVGDWKQGIYGFRNATVENITDFEGRMVAFRRFLNEDSTIVPFHIGEVSKMPLDVNYRSSQEIVDSAFSCLEVRGSESEELVIDRSKIQLIKAAKEDRCKRTHVRYVNEPDIGDAAVRCIKDYLANPEYEIAADEGLRRVRLGDIAVLCRTQKVCKEMMERLTEAGIPAFYQGDIPIMSTREGKLVLAWLRYVNNEKDPWGYMPIMFDLGYTLAECLAVRNGDSTVPSDIVGQRKDLYAKRRRITDLITSIFAFYSLQNDITQSIITVVSSAHSNSLLTISDIVSMIEMDIEKETNYLVERSIDNEAVTIMTMHKSKGLEFPIVVIPKVDQGNIPATRGSSDTFLLDGLLGLRCTKAIADFGTEDEPNRKIVTSWRTALAKAALKPNYDEERRLMFVAMSRAWQYQTLISSKPSRFMKELSDEDYDDCPPDRDIGDFISAQTIVDPPEISGYEDVRVKFGIHELMAFNEEDGTGGMAEELDEKPRRGKKYGTMIHDCAQLMFDGQEPEEDYPELEEVAKVIDRIRCAVEAFSEIDCALPVEGTPAVLRGRIDLIGVFEDHVEIHDYKTDADRSNQAEYEFQLSVYAHAAAGSYPGKPVRCFIDYVYLKETVEFDPLPMGSIRERVEAALDRRTRLNQN